MKKEYQRTEIVYESFTMSANIAAECRFISDHIEYQCAVDIGGTTILTSGLCEWADPGDTGFICYQIPSDDTKVFSS